MFDYLVIYALKKEGAGATLSWNNNAKGFHDHDKNIQVAGATSHCVWESLR